MTLTPDLAVEGWEWSRTLPPAISDEPELRAKVYAATREQGEERAKAHGVTLVGEPTETVAWFFEVMSYDSDERQWRVVDAYSVDTPQEATVGKVVYRWQTA